MLNNYETVFILTPVLSEEQTKEAVNKFADLITNNGGEIVNREEWGQRKLAYPIQKFSTGYYVMLEFTSDPSFVDTLEVQFRRDDRVMRFLTIKQDKFHHEYAEKRRRNRKEAAKLQEELVPEVEEESVVTEEEA